jgi:hypothetical protein
MRLTRLRYGRRRSPSRRHRPRSVGVRQRPFAVQRAAMMHGQLLDPHDAAIRLHVDVERLVGVPLEAAVEIDVLSWHVPPIGVAPCRVRSRLARDHRQCRTRCRRRPGLRDRRPSTELLCRVDDGVRKGGRTCAEVKTSATRDSGGTHCRTPGSGSWDHVPRALESIGYAPVWPLADAE